MLNGFAANDCAATELNGNTRDGAISFTGVRTATIQGQVHDEKCYYAMGGISGHAGLFSNATELANWPLSCSPAATARTATSPAT